MAVSLRLYQQMDIPAMTVIWNTVVEAGDSFPGDTPLSEEQAAVFFAAQTAAVVACNNEDIVGVYILHPNGIGHLAHTANASYAVRHDQRRRGIGRLLVIDSLERTKSSGFVGLQFNAVVKSNASAIALYQKLGFTLVGTIPRGYRHLDGTLTDTLIYYHEV